MSTTLTHDHGSEAAEEIILSLLLDLERYHVWVQTILFIIRIEVLKETSSQKMAKSVFIVHELSSGAELVGPVSRGRES